MARLPATDPAFTSAADTALRVFSQELPAIPLVQARLLTPFNTKYWSNWPTADNNYIQPGHWWVTGAQLLINVKPASR
jgi:peptide/nickel transport system substrate-binding protein